MADQPTTASLFASLQEHLFDQLGGLPQHLIVGQPIDDLIGALEAAVNALKHTREVLGAESIEDQRNAVSACVANMSTVDRIVTDLTGEIAKGGMLFLALAMESDTPYAEKMVDLFTGPGSESMIRSEVRNSIIARAHTMDAMRRMAH